MRTAEPTTRLHFATALLPTGWATDVGVSSTNGRITAVDAGVSAGPGDSRHAIGLPGMPNLHSHAFQRAMAGMAEHRVPGSDDFWSWREAMYRFVGRITPEQLRDVAAMAQVEMLECGFTRVGEFHYLHHQPDGTPYDDAAMTDAIVEAADETGIALTHLPVFYAFAGFGHQQPEAAQRRFVTGIDQFARLLDACRGSLARLPDAVIGLAPHSLRAVAKEQLRDLVGLAAGAPMHIHVAEQVREVEECLAHHGARPVDWLFDHAPVDASWCLVHATHVEPHELQRIASSGAVVGLCPITEANLGDGLFPAAGFLEAGGRIGVGSDSNVRIDMTEELRLLEYGQRLVHRARNVLTSDGAASTGRRLFEAALVGGGQALGAPGGLAVGHSADLVALDADHPALAGKRDDAILDSLVFAAGRSAVSDVWRHGCHVVSNSRHFARDAIEDRYRATLTALLS